MRQVKGVAEGLSIKLGEMMDQPRHQRIARLAKEEEEKKKGQEQQKQSQAEVSRLVETVAAKPSCANIEPSRTAPCQLFAADPVRMPLSMSAG